METFHDYLKDLDHIELESVLLDFFTEAESSDKTTRYKSKNSTDYINLHFAKNGKINKVELSNNFPKNKIKTIKKKIKIDLIDEGPESIGQYVVFCRARVTGWFKYRDLFQVLPVPSGAPLYSYQSPDNPFLIQFKYRSSTNISVDSRRRQLEVMKYIRLINFFSNCSITINPYARWAWVIDSTNPVGVSCEHKQLGYSYKGFSGKIDKFTDIAPISSLKRTVTKSYYNQLVGPSSSFTLPDNIEASLDLALGLKKDEWNKFYMACSWFYASNLKNDNVRSLEMIGLVISVECLIDKKIEKCECCKQDKHQATKKFKDFLQEYCPFIDKYPTEKKLLYSLRSNLAHGNTMLGQDLDHLYFLGSMQSDEDRIQANADFIIKTAIYNWLWLHK